MSATVWGRFAERVATILAAESDEQTIVERVAAELRQLIGSGTVEIPAEFTLPLPDKYAMYPLFVAPDGQFSIASAVWGVGQATPIHSHETWGVVGVISGVEVEARYRLSDGAPPVQTGQAELTAGEVVVCCTAVDDVHAVRCGGDTPVVAIHVYGTDIGTAVRHAFDEHSGDARPFVSQWCG